LEPLPPPAAVGNVERAQHRFGLPVFEPQTGSGAMAFGQGLKALLQNCAFPLNTTTIAHALNIMSLLVIDGHTQGHQQTGDKKQRPISKLTALFEFGTVAANIPELFGPLEKPCPARKTTAGLGAHVMKPRNEKSPVLSSATFGQGWGRKVTFWA
jgi:hypothetical protein